MQWFEDNTQYRDNTPVPFPEKKRDRLSLIRVYDEKTQPGWGAKEFVSNQERGAFRPDRALRFYQKYDSPFGIVMRSVPDICVDIDGKNGGVETAQILSLPPTLAERSKSGNGYHLIYEVPGTVWNPERGYDEFPDIIGLIPGVDIKGTGIVYHYPHQRWNRKAIAPIPPSLAKLIGRVRDTRREVKLTRQGASSLNEDELLIVHDELRQRLESRFEKGARNSRLYSIGAKMYAALYPAWDTALYDRGLEIGLEIDEIRQIIRNIETYS